MTDGRIIQVSPPGSADMIHDVVSRVSYKTGWEVRLENGPRVYEHLAGGEGLTLRVTVFKEDSTTPGRTVGLDHFFVVPPAKYDREEWERWVFDRLAQIELHECMEFFKVDGFAPYFPPHGDQNGRSPYIVARRKPDEFAGTP